MKYLLFLFLPVFSNAQTFFVSGTDRNCVAKVSEKIRFEGYGLKDSSNADYIVNLLIDGSYRLTLKRAYQGYILITDRSMGREVCRTGIKKANPAALNGYNAAYTIFTNIDKKFLPEALKKCPKKEVASKL